MSRFTKPSINWAEMEKLVPVEQKTSFFAFKAKSDAYYRRVLANPAEPPKINWEEYTKLVPVPGLVDKLKNEYQNLKVPYPEDKLSVKVDEQWKALEPEIQKYCADLQKDIDSATKELTRIKSLPKFDDITMEMFAELYPDRAIDPVNRPMYWPHNVEEQVGYEPPKVKAEKKQ